MFVRRKANKSGSFSVQIVNKVRGRYVLVRSMGASKDENKLLQLEKDAAEYIRTYGGQLNFDFSAQRSSSTKVTFGNIKSIVQNGPHLILNKIYDGIGFDKIGDETLRQLVISRVCQPMSKLATVDYLRRYTGQIVDINRLYRYMDTLDENIRQSIQEISVKHTKEILGGRIGIVFYDVTTLYFESSKEDVLRTPGFSKDGKSAETQIVLGLLVSIDGYPLAYSVFNGAQYEGRTLIPVIDDFVYRFKLTDFIVVADAGLLSRKNINLLKDAGYKFILGGRIKKECAEVVDWVLSLEKDEHKLNEATINGDERLIVSYSEKRATKDRRNRDKGIQRLHRAYSSGKITKQNINKRGYNKFLNIENDVLVSIDQDKIDEDAKWDGLKSYVTNTDLNANQVIEQYHGLWVVESAFRISKGTLETRPIFHFTERRIDAHICICFMAYKLYKELERILRIVGINLSVDKVLEIAKTISTVSIQNEEGIIHSQTMLLTEEQQLLSPLLFTNI